MEYLLAGNWKMNNTSEEVERLISELKAGMLELPIGIRIVIAPAFPFLRQAVDDCERTPFAVAAQNCHEADSGAFTGEVSVPMLKSVGASYCIVGHSERRKYFGESDDTINAKIRKLLAQGITPIYCCGETEEQRTAEKHFETVGKQIETALKGFSDEELNEVVIAYEPVWAIGTGLTAKPEQAQAMHAFIREKLGENGKGIPILYGGSCKPSNANELFACPDVDGGLIGGAALNAADFLELVRILHKQKTDS